MRAEWTKLATLPGATAMVLAAAALTVALGAAAAGALAHTPAAQDPVRLSLAGLDLGQALVAIVAVRVAAGEWETGMAAVTYQATPARHAVLAAKAAVLAGATAAAALAAVVASLVAGHVALVHAGVPGEALTVTPAVARAALGTVIYAALVALLALGVGAVVADRVWALAVTLALLYLFPLAAQMVTGPRWQRLLRQVGPMPAGTAVEATTHLAALPVAPWPGLAILGAWSGGALLAGWIATVRRDA